MADHIHRNGNACEVEIIDTHRRTAALLKVMKNEIFEYPGGATLPPVFSPALR